MILSFVFGNSHGFSFIPWATIGLARIKLPNVNQFFESLYVTGQPPLITQNCNHQCACLKGELLL